MKYVNLITLGLSLLIFFVSNCAVPRKAGPSDQAKSKPAEIYIDPICGDSVIWHIHLQDGFNYDTVWFVINNDSFPNPKDSLLLIAKSGNNGCTGIYLTCYKEEGNVYIFLKNLPPLFNEITEIGKWDGDSLKLKMIINSHVLNMETSLKYNRFYGLNYNPKSHSIAAWKGKSCFECR